ncbi:ATP-grasp peptide maturase system methyltransferase [Spongiactinospora sp. 9N601]|uniref:ATP-grasp peptide maturase system methyltransferase n=1 Tax=Spongiactinospora sp. 9N601 TaxID=3375149 RepID=UPI0037983AD9
MNDPLAAVLRRGLAETLAGGDHLHDPRWRAAVEGVERHAFLGDAVFRRRDTSEGSLWEPVRRSDVGADEWLRMAYANELWVTQIDGVSATDAPGPMTGSPTSSSSMPGVVVRMLEIAGIGEGDSVLEIGTGTGYSTALICHRLGEDAVTSIEYDPAVAARAAAALAEAGYAPTLVQGDGLLGYEKNAEYDRVIATCAVRYIPMHWMWQVKDGGTITAPVAGWMHSTVLAHLTLADDGTASGHFSPYGIAFMPARQHQAPLRPSALYLRHGDERESRIDPRALEGATGRFVAQLAAPSAELIGGGEHVVLLDVATGSQARIGPASAGGWTVSQRGPLRLWDAVEDAILIWQAAGSPPWSRFGMTVTRDDQHVWLGAPDGPAWRLPTA